MVAIKTTRLNLTATGKLTLESSGEEVDITIDIEGMLRRVADKAYEAHEVRVFLHCSNFDLELMGTICFETNRLRRLKSISAKFSNNDDSLVVRKQQAKWDTPISGLHPFSFCLMKMSQMIGDGTFELPWSELAIHFGKILWPK